MFRLTPHQTARQLDSLRQRIDLAAVKSGRTAKNIQIVAVSKYSVIGDGVIETFVENGLYDLGESRPQFLYKKAKHYAALGLPIRWHQIGQLQKNKIRRILPVTALIHSIDSMKLAEAVNRIAEADALPAVHCLLEAAISPDTSKSGFKIPEIPELLEKLAALKNIAVDGLMGIAGLESDERQIHQEFASLRNLAEMLRSSGLPPNISMNTLSMGMSGDFEIAVEEGATCLRLGSILY
ncbi:MAG: YggS family pyridoxal phosphate-dependent enzyme [Planctomycetaceae bacterium]|nr:YggS family pyridoxal phosphate-dependent enzyme [Planctomycetaceae bacterium]